MKLTNTIRDAFVRAAMQDVPSVDYDEQIRFLVLADIVTQLPPKVRAVWDDPALRAWVNTNWTVRGSMSVTVPSPGRMDPDASLTPKVEAKVADLLELRDAQKAQRCGLQQKLKGCAYAATTRKALVDMLPEFERYLPADKPAANRSLPVVANVVAEFTNAGWPKSKGGAK